MILLINACFEKLFILSPNFFKKNRLVKMFFLKSAHFA